MRKNGGLTLIEILVVIVIIIGVVGTIAVTIPAMKERQRQEEAMATAATKSGVSEKAKEALKKVRTKNGHSYVPVDRPGRPSENSDFLLQLMDKFEDEHPEYELYAVNVDFCPWTQGGSAEVYGVWFHYHINAESPADDGK